MGFRAGNKTYKHSCNHLHFHLTRAGTVSTERPVSQKHASKRSRLRRAKTAIAEFAPHQVPTAHLGRLSGQVGYLLRRASSVFTTHWYHQFAGEPVTITPVQCGMMILIDENPGLTQIELARLLRVEGSTLWQLINRLLELGFVHRHRVPEDQRAFAIHLSRAGRLALQRFEDGLQRHQAALLADMSEQERADFCALLMRVIETGERLNAEAEAAAAPKRAEPIKRPASA